MTTSDITGGVAKFLNKARDFFMGGAINHTPQPRFPDSYYRGMGYDMMGQLGNDTVSAVGNAHPAAQASLAVAGTIATAPFAYVAYEYASLQAMLHPEVIVGGGDMVGTMIPGGAPLSSAEAVGTAAGSFLYNEVYK